MDVRICAFYSVLITALLGEFVSSLACPRLILKNGRVRIRSRGRMAQFRCRRGFQLAGRHFAVCLKTGIWSQETPLCVGRGCPKLPKLPNLTVRKLSRGGIAKFTCKAGLRREGPERITCDGKQWSDQPPTCQVGMSLGCDFEVRGLCGWSQADDDKFDWIWHQGKTPTQDTGPSVDHTTNSTFGHYLFIESSAPRKPGDKARLVSPTYQPDDVAGVCLEFYYHMYGHDKLGQVGNMDVFIKPVDVTTTTVLRSSNKNYVVFHAEGNQGNVWHRADIEIPPQQKPFTLLFQGTTMNSWYSDISIDDIRLYNCSDSTTTILTTIELTSAPSSSATTATVTDTPSTSRRRTRLTRPPTTTTTSTTPTTTTTESTTEKKTTTTPTTTTTTTTTTTSTTLPPTTTTTTTTTTTPTTTPTTTSTTTTPTTTTTTTTPTPTPTTTTPTPTTTITTPLPETPTTPATTMTPTHTSTESSPVRYSSTETFDTSSSPGTTTYITPMPLDTSSPMSSSELPSTSTERATEKVSSFDSPTSGDGDSSNKTQSTSLPFFHSNNEDDRKNNNTDQRNGGVSDKTTETAGVGQVKDSNGLSSQSITELLPLIVGVVAAVLVGAVVIGVLTYMWSKKQRQKEEKDMEDQMNIIAECVETSINH